jgi:DNA polymerase-3 subunit epsilon
MIIVGCDTETTGFHPHKGDRIIEACFGIYRYEAGVMTLLKTVTQRINPQRSIPADSQRIHGISYEDVKASPIWSDFAPTVEKILSKADLVVIHNAEFDVRFLDHEQSQAGSPVSKWPPVVCTMETARWATFDGKRPSLAEVCWALGIEYDPSKAHAAAYDVDVMMQAYAKGLSLGLYKLPEGVNNG